ncbi:MAG: uroporphyrinogen decarboxylase family protein [Clostridia bacterium]
MNKKMTPRERFIGIMDYQKVDGLPALAFEPYERTAIDRWAAESINPDFSPEEALGIAELIKVPVNLSPNPRFEHRIFEETDEFIIESDTTFGAKVKKMKSAPSMYYGFLDHQVKTAEDWKRIRFRYEENPKGRIPRNIDEVAVSLNSSDKPVKLEIFPYFFRLGFYLMGMERFMLAFYDQPSLIHEMFSFWNGLTIDMIKPFLSKVDIDVFVLAEDLAYNRGPHLSPEIYKEFWLPYQDRLISEVKSHHVENICLWSAGDIDGMIPLLLDHGINCIWPVERCSPNMDPIVLREKYGRDLRMGGGIPRSFLPLGPDAVDAEIERLMPLILDGGFIPAMDDMVSHEVSLESYSHYVNRLKSVKL